MTRRIIGAVIFFLISALFFVFSIFHFLRRGFLFNNAYLYAYKKEREAMDRAPYYRQSGVMFLIIGLVFVANGVDMILRTDWMLFVVLGLVAAAMVYGIVSSVAIEKKKKG